MSLHLTIPMVELTYDLLRLTKPFKGWKLPPSDDVTFHLVGHVDYLGKHCPWSDGTHEIFISQERCRTLKTLTEVLAHEMCHVRADMIDRKAHGTHGRTWKACADAVCRAHVFDRGAF